ncbi:hypothetical protein LCGC14_0646160 [marine sediment metagenome]|uniref:Sn-glycerol-3-phosphate transporter n=1 Tax=marine sediment metagenome TaxID=412755 RepID=A0A0F9RHA4_9ZZZZ|nr:sn-glycerol-3-phosphate transporter [Methylophaga sp.]HEC58485.1 sn-glycerol-3-phosphate transporter [Methylophaga sp.]
MNLVRSLLCLALLSPLVAEADDNWLSYDHLYLQGGTYTHYKSSSDYSGPDILVSLEAVKKNDWLYGLALFDNSFGQFSQYVYAGKIWNYHDSFEGFHSRVTAGLLHGYRGEYQDNIPFNGLGTAPAIIPSVGYKAGRYGADVSMLGFAGLLMTVGLDL